MLKRSRTESIALLVAALIATAPAVSAAQPADSHLTDLNSACLAPGKSITATRYVTVGGNRQRVTIEGHCCANPVGLMVRGGPGDPNTPSSRRRQFVFELRWRSWRWHGAQHRNLRKQVVRFAMPVYMLQGDEDLVTPPEVSRAYLDGLVAPKKEFLPLTRTGQDPNRTMIDAQYGVLRRVRAETLQTDKR